MGGAEGLEGAGDKGEGEGCGGARVRGGRGGTQHDRSHSMRTTGTTRQRVASRFGGALCLVSHLHRL